MTLLLSHLESATLVGAHDSDGFRKEVTLASLRGKSVALYFSAHWCPPCRAFTPILAAAYKSAKSQGADLEVIYISDDSNEDEFDEYFGTMPWVAVNFDDADARHDIKRAAGVNGIPKLIVLDKTGTIVHTNGRELVQKDKDVAMLKW